MKTLSKYAVAAALTGALALAAATPSQARWYGHGGWHNGGAAAAIGFGAGALLGAAAASAAYPGYYGYDDGAGYAYAPGPYESYGDGLLRLRAGAGLLRLCAGPLRRVSLASGPQLRASRRRP